MPKKKRSNKVGSGNASNKSDSESSNNSLSDSASSTSMSTATTIRKLSPKGQSAINKIIQILSQSESEDESNRILEIFERSQSPDSSRVLSGGGVVSQKTDSQIVSANKISIQANDISLTQNVDQPSNNEEIAAAAEEIIIPTANETIERNESILISANPSSLSLSIGGVNNNNNNNNNNDDDNFIPIIAKPKNQIIAASKNVKQNFANRETVRDARRQVARAQTRSKSSISRSEQQDSTRIINRSNSDIEESISSDQNPNIMDITDSESNNDDDNDDDIYIVDTPSNNADSNSNSNSNDNNNNNTIIATPVARANATLGINTTTTEPKAPQIWIKFLGNFEELIKKINKHITHDKYVIKLGGPNLIRFNSKCSDTYRALVRFFMNEKIEYHTYQQRSERSLRLAIRGIHSTTPKGNIHNELSNLGFTVRNIYNPTFKNHHGQGIYSPNLFFIELDPKNVNNSKIFDLKVLCNFSISVEYRRTNESLVQCERCQNFNHTQKYCHRSPVCVKCGLGHLTKVCTKPDTLPAKCGNCQGSHTANFRGCSYFLKLLNNKNKNSQKATNTNRNTNANTQRSRQQQQQKPQSQPNKNSQQQQQQQRDMSVRPRQTFNETENELEGLLNTNNLPASSSSDPIPIIVRMLEKHSAIIAEIQLHLNELYNHLIPNSRPSPPAAAQQQRQQQHQQQQVEEIRSVPSTYASVAATNTNLMPPPQSIQNNRPIRVVHSSDNLSSGQNIIK